MPQFASDSAAELHQNKILKMEVDERSASDLKNKMLHGDCAGANLSGVQIDGSHARFSLALSGCFTNANFCNAYFKRVDFSGDFSRANFEGARAENCTLSGKFDGARHVGPLIASSWVKPGASFKGANMEGAAGTFDLCDIEHARIGFWDSIAARTGRMQLLGVDCELCKPAQFVEGFIVSGDATSNGPYTVDLRHIEGRVSGSSIVLHDLANLSREIDGVSRCKYPDNMPSHFPDQKFQELCLNAPGVVFKNFQTRECLRLSGNFDRASFKDSKISKLALEWGSFNELDLSGAIIEQLDLDMRGIQIKSPSFPSGLQSVTLVWKSLKKLNQLGVQPDHAAAVIDAWNDKLYCEHLAFRLTASISPKYQAAARNYLGSRGKTLRGVCRRHRTPWYSELATVAALVARRNQL